MPIGTYRTGQGNMTGETGNESMSNGAADMNTPLSTQCKKHRLLYNIINKKKKQWSQGSSKKQNQKQQCKL
eukprot:15351736-Ditylum_brightwellii.AAC.2